MPPAKKKKGKKGGKTPKAAEASALGDKFEKGSA